MIPFGNQRGTGADLATHLMNAFDNERVEIAEIRGAISQDLHGAFEEWELQAFALTRCEKYLYSLSVNPDPKQGELSREQYLDYIDRAEKALGLKGQPRAILFHEKHGREHAHVVWSRIDAKDEKARHIAFDRQKLKAVTIEFARDHGLALPRGYTEQTKNKALSLYDRVKQDRTGLTREDHMAAVTDAWRSSDSPRAFVRALEDRGYLLATGKRPYVLVDSYGETHALPRLIDDKQVRMKDVREFLGKAYPPESLPSVDEAKKLVAEHADIKRALQAAEEREAARAELKRNQRVRRAELDGKFKALAERHALERQVLAERHTAEREGQKSAYREQAKEIKARRARRQKKSLSGFFAEVTGYAAVRQKVERFRDRLRLRTYVRDVGAIRARQAEEREHLKRRQILQKRELERQERALRKIENRERRSLDMQLAAQGRTARRRFARQAPAIGRRDVPTLDREGELSNAVNVASRRRTKLRRKKELSAEFSRVSDDGKQKGGKDDSAASDGPKMRRRRRRDRNNDRGR